MTLRDIHENLIEKHGRDWVKFALYRFAELRTLEKDGGLGYNRDMFQEYQLLSQWVFDTCEAGVLCQVKPWYV